MDWRQVVKVLAVTTQLFMAGWLLTLVAEGIPNGKDAAIIAVFMLSTVVLVLNLAKSLRSADSELPSLKQELEKAELRLKLHSLKAKSQEGS